MHQFIVGVYTDVGTRKKINQDSVYVEVGESGSEQVLLAAICDGLGGLAEGEVASARMVHAVTEWFENSLAEELCKNGGVLTFETFRNQYDSMIHRTGDLIAECSLTESGTTFCALLCVGGIYYTANVGDSRCYKTEGGELIQLTKDQTLVQREYDRGRLSKEEMETHPKRSVLLQCIGATDAVVPEYTSGTYRNGDLFLLCSDGFRHKIDTGEMMDILLDGTRPTEQQLSDRLEELTERVKERGEKDNISSIAIVIAKKSRFEGEDANA